jgi:GNAT superfamily N-acetyltransferase
VTTRTDLALARRLERAEAAANAAFVTARAALDPASGAAWLDADGAWAMFDGVGSPITQTFGFGLFAPAAPATLDALEAFLDARGAEVHHEVAPLADPAHLGLLAARGYHPVELTTVLCRPIADVAAGARAGAPAVRPARDDERDAWAELSARGWGGTAELSEFVRGFARVTARAEGTTCFVAEIDGAPVGTAALALHGGVALLAGASTLPEWRGRGAQGALLAARLAHAAGRGCDLAMMGALPGSTSQLNAERAGLRVAYTRTKWRRGAPPTLTGSGAVSASSS